jgi:hypothetical protein
MMMAQVGQKLYGEERLAYGFRAPSLVRFVNAETAYLSPTNGGARMYINMEDHVSYNTGRPNVEFLVRYFCLGLQFFPFLMTNPCRTQTI